MSKETERLYDVIKKSLITEKSVAATENAQYTFEVKKMQQKLKLLKLLS